MPTTEIQLADWRAALEEFSAVHQGWLLSIDVLTTTVGPQGQVRDLPLLGVTLASDAGHPVICVAVARSAESRVTHVIHDPIRILLDRTSDEADRALEIESAGGEKCILWFRSAPRPETVDALVLR
jgi:hypothetical protein